MPSVVPTCPHLPLIQPAPGHRAAAQQRGSHSRTGQAGTVHPRACEFAGGEGRQAGGHSGSLPTSAPWAPRRAGRRVWPGRACAVPEETVMTAHIDEGALQSSLQRLREAAFDADVAGVMKRTVDAVHGVFGYGGAGVMFITESGYLSYVAASDEAGRQLEEAQASAGQGPCYESYVYARAVVSSDVHADSRWPELPTRL